MFIGYINLANIVTALGLSSGLLAIFSAAQGRYTLSVLMLLVAGLCDMFDGRIARNTGGRQAREKLFGIQLDSLSDLICFGVAPAMIAFFMGHNAVPDLALYLFFIIAGATRLAYYNTQAMNREPDAATKFFTGVPIPFSCIAFPVLMLVWRFVPNAIEWSFRVFFLAVGLAFILKVKIRKPDLRGSLLIIAFDVVCLAVLFFFGE